VELDVARARRTRPVDGVDALRPVPVGQAPEPGPRRRVLVLGICLVERPNTAEDCIASFSSSHHDVEQRWIALGREPAGAALAELTVEVVREWTPKYELLQRRLDEEDLTGFDYIVMTDDDVVLPRAFLDWFLPYQERHGLVLAQPARTLNSWVDHPIVIQQGGSLARRTRFVEIGPVASVAREAFELCFPSEPESPMGWGYDNVWAHRVAERGLAMGIVDAVPVDHSLRPPVANYDWATANGQRDALFAAHPHLSFEDCFRVLDVVSAPELAA
jgi:hypothetical protein